MRVIGLDPSITATGIARADGTLDVVGGKPEDGDRRLQTIRDEIRLILLVDRPHLAVLEDLPKNAQTAGITGMVQGVIRCELIAEGVPYVLVVPSTLKKYATGDGRADKSDLRMALFVRAAINEKNDNKVDAWWLRHLGLDYFGEAPVRLPALQRKSLDVPKWPAGIERIPAP